jgi:AcrR family transcriptional regulator
VSGNRGRPRSDQAHQAILEATRDLLASGGYEGLTIEAIALRAGVGKQTVYRWWPSKSAIVAESVLTGVIGQAPIVLPDTGDIVADLRSWVRGWLARLNDERDSALVRALTVATAERQADGDRLYETSVAPFRAVLIERLQSGRQQGSVRPDVNVEAVTDALMGVALYRVLARSEAPSDTYADGLTDVLIRGICSTG